MKSNKRISTVLGVVIVIVILCGGCTHWYLNSTASGGRVSKDVKSEFNNGIPRDIKVYNADGKVIMEEKGKFDIKHSSRSLQYIDQNNRKHNIYFGDNSTVTVDELK